MNSDSPAVQYIETNRIAQSLGRVEGRVQGIDERMTRVENAMTIGFSDLRKQIESLAASDNRRKGALVAISGVVSAAVTYAVEKLVRS